MNINDFTTTIQLEQSPKEVFNAINTVDKWWQGEIKGGSHKLHDEFSYQMEEFHFSKQKVVEFIPDKKVVWLVTESKLNFTKDPSEWTGTRIVFEISEINKKSDSNRTQMRFTHMGLVPNVECYQDCSNGWSMLIQKSLLSYITTGKGKKVF